jgi:hypothetical protein
MNEFRDIGLSGGQFYINIKIGDNGEKLISLGSSFSRPLPYQ